LMDPESLPSINEAKGHYEIDFDKYSIAIFHPITTEYPNIASYIKEFVQALIKSKKNYIVIYPNNDLGSIEILNKYESIKFNERFKIYPSLRFEYFLTLLKNSEFIVGNSSAGIREAPYYGVPTVDIGTRQLNRAKFESIFHSSYQCEEILNAITRALSYKNKKNMKSNRYFGDGKSDKLFYELLKSGKIWKISHQKQFKDLR